MRKIVVNDQEYRYRIGRTFTKIVSLAGGKPLVVNHSQMTGMSWDDLERMSWKNGGYTITPAMVRARIVMKGIHDGI